MTANPGGGDYRPDARETPDLLAALQRSVDRARVGLRSANVPTYADARETGTDGITNLEGELAQLRDKVQQARVETMDFLHGKDRPGGLDGRFAGPVGLVRALIARADAAEAALTRVRAEVKSLKRYRKLVDGLFDRGGLQGFVECEVYDAAVDALDGPATSATSPSPASTGDTGTPGGSAPSDSPSEAQGHATRTETRRVCGKCGQQMGLFHKYCDGLWIEQRRTVTDWWS